MRNARATKGAKIIAAIIERRTTKVIGGTELESIRATIKLPDQITVAARTKK